MSNSDVGSPNKQQPILIKIYSRTKNSFWTLAVTPSTTVLRVCEQICDKRGIERGTLSLHYAPLKNLNSFISLQEEALILQQKEHIQKTVGDFDFIVLTEEDLHSIQTFDFNQKNTAPSPSDNSNTNINNNVVSKFVTSQSRKSPETSNHLSKSSNSVPQSDYTLTPLTNEKQHRNQTAQVDNKDEQPAKSSTPAKKTRSYNLIPNLWKSISSEKRAESSISLQRRDSYNRVEILSMHSASKIPLHRAAESGNLAEVTSFLKKGENPDSLDEDSCTPLHKAVMNGHVEIIQCLLENGAKVNLQDTLGNSALHKAAISSSYTALYTLINSGADVNLRNSRGELPIHNACVSGDLSCVFLLLKQGTDVNTAGKFSFPGFFFLSLRISPFLAIYR